MRHAGAMNSLPSADPACYWVLLTSTLQFCYTSPSFNAIVPEAKQLIGRRFTDYLNQAVISPDAITQRLRASYLDEEDRGTVIGIEYANVTAIRHHLQTSQFFPDHAYTFSPYSLVTSRAGGFILAFLHLKTEISRDCDFHLCEPLKPGDLSGVGNYLPALESQPPYRVFQILSDDERRPIIFTTPTTLAGRLTIVPTQLAEGTQNPRECVTNQGQTSCTKRTKITFALSTLEGQLLSVSCILLRHGNALLVMYRLTPLVPPQPVSPAIPVRYNPLPGVSFQAQNNVDYRRLSTASDNFTQPSPIQQSGVVGIAQPPYAQPYSPDSTGHAPRAGSFDAGYPPTSPDDARSIVSSPHSPVSMRNHHRSRGISMRRFSMTDSGASPTAAQSNVSPMGSLEEREPIPHPLHSPTDSSYMMERSHRLSASSSIGDSAVNEVGANALRGRPAKDPPKGVTCCRVCQTTVTPEWRKGPSGVKDMCNACGLRWNRRLKKMKGEGGTNIGESGMDTFPQGFDTDTLLEPQRSGGGSKKGHRKKTIENRGPALTTKPQKMRRTSDALLNSAGAGDTSPFPNSPDEMKYDPQHHHPHNPHYAHGGSNPSRPSLPSIFKDEPIYSPPSGPPPPLQTPLIPSINAGTSPSHTVNYHARDNHSSAKPSSDLDSPRAYYNTGAPSSATDHPHHSTPFSPGSYNGNINGGLAGLNGNHPHPHHPERPALHMPGVSSYNTSDHHQHSPHFDRHILEATPGPSSSSSVPNVYGNSR